ncbi:MAG: class I SAM-dependent methyltransferase [Thermoplasmata archaeon]|nr:class I SAM-dependent methyltransferase [Thermoplasmata archaeon]
MSRLGDISGYWTKRAEGYSDTVTESIDSGRSDHWLNIIREQLEPGRALRVLDVGTGPGFFPVILGRDGHRVTGIDCTQGMLDQAAENCARYGVEADFARMDAQHLDFGDGTFDLVISRNVVWNLEDPLGAYREWLRVLKDGGKLMIFDGNHYLYLYDAEFRDAGGDRESKEHPPTDGVDVSVMRDIARDLPLSRQRRPQWDLENLIELGVQRVFIETDGRDSCRAERDGETVYLPFSFFICATK